MYQPSDEQRELVETLVALRVPLKVICRDWISPPIAKNTLRRAFLDEIQHGRERISGGLMLHILRRAEQGHLKACTYLLGRVCPEFAPPVRVPLPASGR